MRNSFLNNPYYLSAGGLGEDYNKVWICDKLNHVIRVLDSDGNIKIFAGNFLNLNYFFIKFF
jgi:hypothetical protein